ncbi:MAG: ABC-2 transporter permease, partial [Terrisporobacter sp.]|uniref:ABC-2 transporter permease n=1 Tax=Terrisporobacter sp. TaxID=1965305 RepID=UPI002FC93197
MINLLKKDLIACFKADIKIIVKLIVGILIFSLILFPISPIVVPLFISYIFILRSFQIDELNKCDYLFNSLPIEKEDIVYSKYLFSTIVIMISLIFTYFY